MPLWPLSPPRHEGAAFALPSAPPRSYSPCTYQLRGVRPPFVSVSKKGMPLHEWDNDGQVARRLPVIPSVAASKHIPACIRMCFKETSTTINNA